MRKSFACMVVWVRNFKIWSKSKGLCDQQVRTSIIITFIIRVSNFKWLCFPDIPDTGLLCDLLWADPDKEIVGWGENDRGVSFTFGEDIVAQFLRRHDLDLICRAHQVVEDGYEFFARRQLVTIFSAPNYCGEFDNAGAMMSVDDTLMCSFQILKPAEKRQRLTQAGAGEGTNCYLHTQYLATIFFLLN